MESPLPLSPESSDFSGMDPGIPDLVRSIRRAEGSFAIFIATCNDAAWRDRCISQLKDLVPGSLVASCSPATEDPLTEIGQPALPPACIHLIRLELAVPGDESRLAPLRMLNLRREHWRTLSCPIVLWLPEYLFGLLMRRAPDFADWRSASLTFTPPPNLSDRFASTVSKERLVNADSPGWNASIREKRITELTDRLKEQLAPHSAAATDHIQAEWCDELARLLVLDRRPEDEARAYHALALAFWEAREEPAQLASSWGRMGEAFLQVGNSFAAHSAFLSFHRITTDLVASDLANPTWQRDLFVSLTKLGDLAVAGGDLTAALGHFTDGLAIAQRLTASDTDNAGRQRDLSVSLEQLGDISVARGDLPAALGYFTEGLAIAERLVASAPANARWQRDLSVSLERLGDIAVARGDLPTALDYFTDVLAIVQRLAVSDPTNATWQRDLSISLDRLGELAVNRGDLPAALKHFTEGYAIAERLAAGDPANAGWQRDFAVSINQLGSLSVARGDLPCALRYFNEGLAIAERLAASDPANTGWQNDLSYSLTRIAQVHLKQEQWREALPLIERALSISEKLAATDSTNVICQQDVRVRRRLLAEIRAKLDE